ncbi:MAG: branched-chain amino acid ABC transporter permease, partial [Gammaproteobacteria bacterium]|nr:branched-chain amino acid ABC transporter permease [Gammaproteobacteria bacterium]
MSTLRAPLAFLLMAGLLLAVGFGQSWSVALTILNMCLVSAIMALGVNIQWGYAGLFNAGVMAFTALGGLAAVLVSHPPVREAWAAGGAGLLISVLILVVLVLLLRWIVKRFAPGWQRKLLLGVCLLSGYVLLNHFYAEARRAIEAVDPSASGFLGGLGLPIMLSWPLGGLLAAAVAWLIGKLTLGLRSDYLAIATLGISEIVIAVLKNEDWLARGVKNVSGLDRPVPMETDLQNSGWFISLVESLNGKELSLIADSAARGAMLDSLVVEGSGIAVKLCYAGLFSAVLLLVLGLSIRALNSPWGRMMRAIRDNEEAAGAM